MRRVFPGALCLAGVSLVFQEPSVQVDVKPGVELTATETFQWIEGLPAPNALTHQRITSAVENELAIKGFWRDDEEPDLYLSYYVAVRAEVVIDSPYRTDWYDDGTIQIRRIHEGTLVLDVIDASENELLWRGIVTRTLSDNPRRNDSKIHDTVRTLLESFPP